MSCMGLLAMSTKSKAFAAACGLGKMAGHFDSVSMRGLYGGGQLVRRDVHVGFERSGAARNPEFDHLACVFRVLQLVHLQSESALAFEIRAGHMNFRAGKFACVDCLLEFEVSIGFEAAGCSNRSDA